MSSIIKSESHTLTMIGIAQSGVYGRGITQRSETSSTTSRISTYDTELDKYYYRLIEGGKVIDKRPAFEANYSACIRGVISGPMDDMDLEPGMVYRVFSDIIPLAQAGQLSGVDSVAWDIYADYWRKLGSRLGVRAGDTIVWEDGTIEPIITPEKTT